MDPRERVLAAARREKADRTPRDFWAEKPALSRLFDHVGHRDEERLLEHLGIDVRHLSSEEPPERQVRPGVMQRLLPRGSPEDVRREARRYCEAFAGGGYILGPAHLFQPDVPPENILAMYA